MSDKKKRFVNTLEESILESIVQIWSPSGETSSKSVSGHAT